MGKHRVRTSRGKKHTHSRSALAIAARKYQNDKKASAEAELAVVGSTVRVTAAVTAHVGFKYDSQVKSLEPTDGVGSNVDVSTEADVASATNWASNTNATWWTGSGAASGVTDHGEPDWFNPHGVDYGESDSDSVSL